MDLGGVHGAMNAALSAVVRTLPKLRKRLGDGHSGGSTGNASHATKAARELDILMMGSVGKASHFMKDIGFDKDRLVSKKRSVDCADPPQQLLLTDHPQLPAVEPAVKRSANNHAVPRDLHEGFEVLITQLGICMVKAQERPARLPRAGVQLRAARRRVASNQVDSSSVLKLP